MIPRRISAAFPADLRARGDQYFSTRRVHIARANATALRAIVNGTSDYIVDLRAEHGTLTAMCTCPYAIEHGICKHVWATLRDADAVGDLLPMVRTLGNDARLVVENKVAALRARPPELPRSILPPMQSRRPGPPPPAWKALLDSAQRQMANLPPADGARVQTWPADRRIVYIVDLAASARSPGIVVELATERLNEEGGWDPPVAFKIPHDVWQTVPDPLDRRIAQMLIGAPPPNPYGAPPPTSGFVLRAAAFETTLRPMCETGRCRVRREPGERPLDAVRFDDGAAWELRVRVVRQDIVNCFMDAVLARNGDEMRLSDATLLHPEGLLFARGSFARFDHHGAFALVPLLIERRSVHVPASELPALLENLYSLPRRPAVELPPDAQVVESRTPPRLGVAILGDPSPWRGTHHRIEPFFLYGDVRIDGNDQRPSIFDRGTLTVHHRDLAQESAAREHLRSLGAKEEWTYADHRSNGERSKILILSATKLMRMVVDLVPAGWRIEAEGAVYRGAGQPRTSIRSGIDWFELDAGVRYGDIEVSLYELMVARKSGATTITLSDGSRGVIPLEWLARLAPIAASGTLIDGALRFSRAQTALLDAMLATLPEADVDATFEKARTTVRTFDRVAAADPPKTFRGKLREYQREGLGWLHFLREFGLGGCLADDMGLGKTVQVLALLDSRRSTPSKPTRPSIVVVPRSLVFNWMREAERFAPKLRMLDYTGPGRKLETIDERVDVVITTYGTLRRDAALLSKVRFDYAILDEAQAIKTSSSASSKAARLLNADHRLAMTGTPIENRIDELWSLFEFLNPGMLGPSRAFTALARLAPTAVDDAMPADASAKDVRDDRGVLARALRPVILRRTKSQVAADLPARIEQTLSVELEGPQRKFYDDLLESYRRSVLERVDKAGIGKARMHILEALLRLRQAACHPALADPRKTAAPSAKLDALIPALEEVVSEGHKALVFSQFTSFLALVRARLDEAGTTYEYLDGDTRDRQAHVDRFQNDPQCSLFLISLKAGGHGLNLTSADYVFILDPWWNPAVEAQAIDRAHRIGQTRRVIATRIVARDTIEEKILELQASKRALADAILGQDQGVLSQIGRAELELLLQ